VTFIILVMIAENMNIKLDLREKKEQEAGDNCILRSFITCTLNQLLLRW